MSLCLRNCPTNYRHGNRSFLDLRSPGSCIGMQQAIVQKLWIMESEYPNLAFWRSPRQSLVCPLSTLLIKDFAQGLLQSPSNFQPSGLISLMGSRSTWPHPRAFWEQFPCTHFYLASLSVAAFAGERTTKHPT